MRYERILLENFIPLLHGGIKKIEFRINGNPCAIIGQNGSGKSSLFRELTVYPATSTDYTGDARKVLTVSHNDKTYVLTSEFSGKKSFHSFIVDGEEQNVSNNSLAQTSLCIEHFGIDILTEKLISGNLLLSRMSKVDRKNVLAACYPSDMTFILNHHKKVRSSIKSLKDNIKLISSRKFEIENVLMNENEYMSLSSFSSRLVEFRNLLVQWDAQYKKELAYWKTNEYNVEYIDSTPSADVVQTLCDLIARHRKILSQLPNITKTDIATSRTTALAEKRLCDESKFEMMTRIGKIKSEIDEYDRLSDRNLGSELADIEKAIKSLEDEISTINIDKQIDIHFPIFTDGIHLEVLQNMVSVIHNTEGVILTSEEYDRLLVEYNDHLSIYNSCKREISIIDATIEQLSKKKTQAASAAFNSSCKLPCQLKDNFQKTVEDINSEISQVTDKKSKVLVEFNAHRSRLLELKPLLDNNKSCREAVRYFENLFDNNTQLKRCVIGDNDLKYILNNNVLSITNMVNRVITNSINREKLGNLRRALTDRHYKRKVIVESQLPAKALISKSLIEKKAALIELSDQYGILVDRISNYAKVISATTALLEMKDQLSIMEIERVEYLNKQIVKFKISSLEELLNTISHYISAVDEKFADLRSTLRSQDQHRIVLREELIPTLTKLQDKLITLEPIEKALSPTTGLPNIYMVRFINSCIKTVNEFISVVWEKDMQLSLLQESETLDFSFEIVHNGNSTVKDISICSNGEQEIINLAWTLALCIHKGYGLNYPIKSDECDSGMTPGHRERLLTLLSNLVRQGALKQLFIINHFSTLFTSFANSQIVCLNPDGITLPMSYNEDVEIVYC